MGNTIPAVPTSEQAGYVGKTYRTLVPLYLRTSAFGGSRLERDHPVEPNTIDEKVRIVPIGSILEATGAVIVDDCSSANFGKCLSKPQLIAILSMESEKMTDVNVQALLSDWDSYVSLE